MNPFIISFLCGLLLLCVSPLAAQERQLGVAPTSSALKGGKVALVLGNADYEKATKLKNPTHDAADLAQALQKLGFTLIGGQAQLNLDKQKMERAMADFGRALRNGGVGVFYYAGHGMQVAGHNYLVPVDAEIESETDIKYRSVDVDYVLGLMEEAGNELNFVILDACRNNPFGRSFSRAANANEGLAQLDAPAGTLIAYATSPNRTAADGTGRNGTYTAALLKHLTATGLDHLNLFQTVREEVFAQSKGKQIPWESNSTRGRFYFVAGVSPADEEADAWEQIKGSRNAADFQSYLDVFGEQAPHAQLARFNLRRLRETSPPIVAPTPALSPEVIAAPPNRVADATISITGPDEVSAGAPVTLSAHTSAPDATYNWVVSCGAIISGQGTPVITLDTAGCEGRTATATVELGGLPPTMNNVKSFSFNIKEPSLRATLHDQFGKVPMGEAKARLDNFAIHLQNAPGTQGYIIVYGECNTVAWQQAQQYRSYLIDIRGFDPARLVFIEAGCQILRRFDLFLVPAGAPAPLPETGTLPCPPCPRKKP